MLLLSYGRLTVTVLRESDDLHVTCMLQVPPPDLIVQVLEVIPPLGAGYTQLSLTYVELELVTGVANEQFGYALLVWLLVTEPDVAAEPEAFVPQATVTF